MSRITNATVAEHILTKLNARLVYNLRLECLDEIQVFFTRQELMSITGASRIEHATMEGILEAFRGDGYTVHGSNKSQHFIISFDPRKYLTNFNTLGDLCDANQFIEEYDIFPEPCTEHTIYAAVKKALSAHDTATKKASSAQL